MVFTGVGGWVRECMSGWVGEQVGGFVPDSWVCGWARVAGFCRLQQQDRTGQRSAL